MWAAHSALSHTHMRKFICYCLAQTSLLFLTSWADCGRRNGRGIVFLKKIDRNWLNQYTSVLLYSSIKTLSVTVGSYSGRGQYPYKRTRHFGGQVGGEQHLLLKSVMQRKESRRAPNRKEESIKCLGCISYFRGQQ